MRPNEIPTSNQKWLLVDDDVNLLALVTTQIKFLVGCETVACSSPLAALERVRRSPESYEFIVTDRHMPGLLGEDLLAELANLNPALRAVVATGDDTGLGAALDRRAVCATILRKPFRIEHLRSAIETAPGLADCRELLAIGNPDQTSRPAAAA